MLVADPNVDPLGLAACEAIVAQRSLAAIRYFREVDSTNTAALRDLEVTQDLPLPRLYLADFQTAGRGRHGRSWMADGGTLTFSLAVSTAEPLHGRAAPLSIAIGVAIARTIDHLAAPLHSQIKWPNDVYLGEGKVAGILIDANNKPAAAVIGVGLNVATRFGGDSQMYAGPTTSICELNQRYPNRYHWLAECVHQMFAAIDEQQQQPEAIIEDHRRRCWLQGQMIRYYVNGDWREGWCAGIDGRGALLVHDDGTIVRLLSGEVHRVRRA